MWLSQKDVTLSKTLSLVGQTAGEGSQWWAWGCFTKPVLKNAGFSKIRIG